MGLEVVLLLLGEPALLDALVVGVLGLEVDAPAALQGAAIVRFLAPRGFMGSGVFSILARPRLR